MSNPLDQAGVRFNFAGTNARVQARNGKDGPIYRVSFEVDQATGEQFMGANLVGKIYGGQLMLIDPDQGDPTPEPTPAETPALKGGSVSRDAALLCKNREFQEYVHSLTGQTPCEDEATYHLKHFCLINSRKELDHDPDAFQRFLTLFKDYGQWRKKNGRLV